MKRRHAVPGHAVLALALLAAALGFSDVARAQDDAPAGLTSPAPPIIPVTPAAPPFVPSAPIPSLPVPAPTAPVQAVPAPPPPTVQTPVTPPLPPTAEAPVPSPVPPPFPAAPAPEPPPPANDWQPRTTVELQALDKVSARTTALTGKVGDTLHFGSLSIVVKACLARPPDQRADSAVFLDITDAHPGVPGFQGWMLAAEPGLTILEHPLYDIRLTQCR